MSEIKNGGLDQYGAKPFEQQQVTTVGVKRVNKYSSKRIGLKNCSKLKNVEIHL